MIIGDYIRKLLDERKRVVLPGFGNLQVKETTGKVYPSKSRMDPPGMFVRFDPSFSKDDTLLFERCSNINWYNLNWAFLISRAKSIVAWTSDKAS